MRSRWAREIRGGGGEIRGRRLANQRAAADAAVYAEITGEWPCSAAWLYISRVACPPPPATLHPQLFAAQLTPPSHHVPC